MLEEPLEPHAAKQLICEILKSGTVSPSQHALDEMRKDEMTLVDAVNVLRAGVVDFPEYDNGSWRYRARTSRMAVVIAFRSENTLRIVTAWRY